MSDSTTRDKILECYRRAEDARRFVDTATSPEIDIRDVSCAAIQGRAGLTKAYTSPSR
jgi:hypothetical protein